MIAFLFFYSNVGLRSEIIKKYYCLVFPLEILKVDQVLMLAATVFRCSGCMFRKHNGIQLSKLLSFVISKDTDSKLTTEGNYIFALTLNYLHHMTELFNANKVVT